MLMAVWSPYYQGGINHAHIPWGQELYIAINNGCVCVFVCCESETEAYILFTGSKQGLYSKLN